MTEFEAIYKLMKESFPDSEYRSYEEQLRLLRYKNYKLIKKYSNSTNELIAFMALWEFEDFKFIEHIAVTDKLRGKGIGSELLTSYIKTNPSTIILEVDPPINVNSQRRIKFYEKLGFYLNDFRYEQPPLKQRYGYIELKIMSYPKKMKQNEFLKYKEKIYKTVYGI